MLGYLLAHITFFTRRKEEDDDGSDAPIRLPLIPLFINGLFMCALGGFTHPGVCSGTLSAFLLLVLLYSLLMTVFSLLFIWDKFDTKYKLFHAISCVYLFTTIAGFVTMCVVSLNPGPPESCREATPWLYFFCLFVAILNLISALLFCPCSGLHLLFYMCGSMTCPQGAIREENGVEGLVVNCANFHPEYFLMGSIRHVV